MNSMEPIDAVILSAGRASRFGVPKFMLPAGPGEVLLTRVLAQALQVADGRVVVVLGHQAALARYALEDWLARHSVAKARVRMVQNPDFAQGQSTSLKAGIQALQGSQGAVVFLADMPGLDGSRLARLRRGILQRAPTSLAVAPSEWGQVRPPVFLSASLFAEIAYLTGDQGARALLQARNNRVEWMEWGSGLWFSDVDTWENYRYLARARSWAKEPVVRLPRETRLVSEVERLMESSLASETVPWLAPGLLLLASEGEPRWIVIPQSYRGVQGIILGPAQTPADYLNLLRRASLAVLAEEN